MDYGMDYQGGGGGFGGGGGGYGNPTGGGAPSGSQPPSSGGRARRSYDEQCLIPVTIRMILSARPESGSGDDGTGSSGALELEDGRKLSHVQLVAATRAVEDMSTNVVYTVEDGTGLMDVKLWLDDNACTALTELRQPTCQDHTYLKIVGTVKHYDNTKMLVADSVKVLRTSNELTHHFLEVVYSAEKARRKSSYVPPMHHSHPQMSGVGFGSAPPPSRSGAPLHAQNNMGGASGSGGGGSLADMISRYIQERTSYDADTSVSIDACMAEFSRGGRYTESDVRKAFDDLSSEGFIYSTLDDNHYRYA